jgi:uncharacterized protein (DUF2249 family)
MRNEHLLDVTQLEPPAPLQMALEAIESLPAGDYLRLLTQRDPVFLYPLLLMQDFVHETRSLTESGYEILIWRKGDEAAEQAAHGQ